MFKYFYRVTTSESKPPRNLSCSSIRRGNIYYRCVFVCNLFHFTFSLDIFLFVNSVLLFCIIFSFNREALRNRAPTRWHPLVRFPDFPALLFHYSTIIYSLSQSLIKSDHNKRKYLYINPKHFLFMFSHIVEPSVWTGDH